MGVKHCYGEQQFLRSSFVTNLYVLLSTPYSTLDMCCVFCGAYSQTGPENGGQYENLTYMTQRENFNLALAHCALSVHLSFVIQV